MIDPMGIRYQSETQRVWAWLWKSIRGYEYKNLPVAYVLAGEYFLYPIRTCPVAIPIKTCNTFFSDKKCDKKQLVSR
jgi:hypothetical protein